ncbi:MAG TPA: MerR family transcriptional regulator [Candidatus Binataceae bacterium]|nr:MerR family transcriptional regulator [Candidatus Binataceae bacterium]
MTRTQRPASSRKRKRTSKGTPPRQTQFSLTLSGSGRTDAIPERGLKIGEAARALGVETFVLRFWETQFPILKPSHSRTKHRFYHERDLEVLRLIKRLLHQEGFTIAGANKHIKEHGLDALMSGKAASKPSPAASESAAAGSSAPSGDPAARRVLSELRRDLESIHRMLKE